jgi:TetR/AcrR family transcriptional regulator
MNHTLNESLSNEMENNILQAATRVFVKLGRKGTSMQDIADEAGVNRTLLNYYFRSKDKLFDLIFERVFAQLLPDLVTIISSEVPFRDKIVAFVEHYYRVLLENPMIPLFIMHELGSNPERLIKVFMDKGIRPKTIIQQIRVEMDNGIIRRMDPTHVLINMLSLIIFPFAAAPIIETYIFEGNKSKYENYMHERMHFLQSYCVEILKP